MICAGTKILTVCLQITNLNTVMKELIVIILFLAFLASEMWTIAG